MRTTRYRNPNLLIEAAAELGKHNPEAAAIAQHLLRQRQLAKTDPRKLVRFRGRHGR